jgi:2-dehydro-3-deoxygalactonokinase
MSSVHVLGDWGSTRLRLWRVRDGAIADRSDGPGIIGLMQPPADVLRAAMAPWIEHRPPERITVCGMAGARGGLYETDYAECPADAAEWAEHAAALDLDGLPVRIAAGCAASGQDGGPDDVMRGEETQVFGAPVLKPELGSGRHMVVLPGTHSKWVTMEDGRIAGFRTFLTGELFALLLSSSLLGAPVAGDDSEGFAAGIARAKSTPGLIGNLFETRVQQLRHGRSPQWAHGFLSGLLIGNEIAAVLVAGPLPAMVTLIGAPALTDRYCAALAAFDVVSEPLDGDACVLAGLRLLDNHY